MFLRPNSALKQTPPSPWYNTSNLTHAHSQINLAAAAMDSCFVLIKTHQYGTALGERFLLAAVYRCHCSDNMAVRKRKILAIPRSW